MRQIAAALILISLFVVLVGSKFEPTDGVRLASIGHDVIVGSRSKYRAMEVADTLNDRWSSLELAIEASDNQGAADADVVRFLKLFTALPLDEIARLAALQGAEINDAKKVLATEATASLHRGGSRVRRLVLTGIAALTPTERVVANKAWIRR